MNASGDAAEQIVRISLESLQTVAKISGEGALEIAKLLCKELKTPKKSKGRASLSAMLKSQKPIKVFEIDDKSLKKFCEEARRYGVMYHILKDKSSNSGKCDIMVKAEDASKVNRIFDRFKLGVSPKATIKKKIEKSQQKSNDIDVPEKKNPEKSEADKFIDELFAKPHNKEATETKNPQIERTVKPPPFDLSSQNSKKDTAEAVPQKQVSKKKSVRKKVAEIKENKKRQETVLPVQNHTNNKSKGRYDNGRSR